MKIISLLLVGICIHCYANRLADFDITIYSSNWHAIHRGPCKVSYLIHDDVTYKPIKISDSYDKLKVLKAIKYLKENVSILPAESPVIENVRLVVTVASNSKVIDTVSFNVGFDCIYVNNIRYEFDPLVFLIILDYIPDAPPYEKWRTIKGKFSRTFLETINMQNNHLEKNE